ncbi:MAG: sigma-70 family RNA polymerase sigma factor [Xanthomonadales bacterium]|nr:sigma-70 family RNA polymerase sigma factor [Xanthomonadales bacterium]
MHRKGMLPEVPGSQQADLQPQIYAELMKLARSQLARSGTMSLDAPSLVHEAWLRFSGQPAVANAGRSVFFAYASKVMRAVVIDYVRERKAQKRGAGEVMLTLTTGQASADISENNIEQLHDALEALETIDPRSHQIIELRYFGGLTETEIADILRVSVPTIRRDWRKARAFLFDAMAGT